MTNIDDINKDKDSALIAVCDDYKAYKFLTAEHKSIKAIALVAVAAKYKALKWVPESLRDDKEIVLTALRNNYKAIKWIPKWLLLDDEILDEALEYGGDSFEGIINVGIFNKLIQASNVINQFTVEELMQNKSMVKKMMSKNSDVYQALPEQVKEDKELAIFALQQVKSKPRNFDNCPSPLCHIPDKLLIDMEVLIAAVRAFPSDMTGSFYSGGALSFLEKNHHYYNNLHKIDRHLLFKTAVENHPSKDNLIYTNEKKPTMMDKAFGWLMVVGLIGYIYWLST